MKFIKLEEYNSYFIIFGFSIVFLVLLIGNPGYFNHDELQKLDHIYMTSLVEYLDQYVKIYAADSFGTPVRPLSFAIQGFLALLMENYTVIVHLIAVIMHGIVACILYSILIRLELNKKIALTSSLIFVISPTSIIATGWSAALMDRLYVLFGLLTLLFVINYLIFNKSKIYLLLVFVSSFLSIASKETAMILPFLMLLFILKDFNYIKCKRFWISFIIWFIPIIIFLFIRIPAIINSFENPSVKAYSASFSNVIDGVLVYFTYPFIITLSEAGNWVFEEWKTLLLATIFHFLIIILIYLNNGIKYVLGYLFLYFIFLLPVLLIPIKGSHYMYGSGIVLSVIVASFIFEKNRLLLNKIFGLICLIILFLHGVYIQFFVYDLGKCMNKMMITSESIYESLGKPEKVIFQAEPGVEEHILNRLYTGRNRIGENFLDELNVKPYNTIIPNDTLLILIDKNCRAVMKK